MTHVDPELALVLREAVPALERTLGAAALVPEVLFLVVAPAVVHEHPWLLQVLGVPVPPLGPLVCQLSLGDLEVVVCGIEGIGTRSANVLRNVALEPCGDERIRVVVLASMGFRVVSWEVPPENVPTRNAVRVVLQALPTLHGRVREVRRADGSAFVIMGPRSCAEHPDLAAKLGLSAVEATSPAVAICARAELLDLIEGKARSVFKLPSLPLAHQEVPLLVFTDYGTLHSFNIKVPIVTSDGAAVLLDEVRVVLLAHLAAFWAADAREESTFLILDRPAYEAMSQLLHGVRLVASCRGSDAGAVVGLCSRARAVELAAPAERAELTAALAEPHGTTHVPAVVLAEDGSTVSLAVAVTRSATHGVWS